MKIISFYVQAPPMCHVAPILEEIREQGIKLVYELDEPGVRTALVTTDAVGALFVRSNDDLTLEIDLNYIEEYDFNEEHREHLRGELRKKYLKPRVRKHNRAMLDTFEQE